MQNVEILIAKVGGVYSYHCVCSVTTTSIRQHQRSGRHNWFVREEDELTG